MVSNNRNIANLESGFISVSVTDSVGCPATEEYDLTEPPVMKISREDTSHPGGFDISCFNYTDGSVDLTITDNDPARGNLNYSWSRNPDDGYTASTQDINNLPVGTYEVSVSDFYGCKVDSFFVLESPTQLTATIADSSNYNGYGVSCYSFNDGYYDLNITGSYGGYVYEWTTADGSLDISNQEDISNVSAGTYNLLVNDEYNCFANWEYTIAEPDTVDINPIITDFNGYSVSCFDGANGAITLQTTGGVQPYGFNWYGDGSGIAQFDEDQVDISAGNYRVTITDDNGCISNWDFSLNQPEIITTTTIPKSISCFSTNNGGIDLDVSGGVEPYEYLWSNGSISQDVSDLFVGSYSVIITDLNGCIKYDTSFVPEPPEIIISLNSPPAYNGRMISCNGASDGIINSLVTGGVGTFRYNWLNLGSTVPDLSGLPAGWYYLEVTDDNECTEIDSIEVIEPNPIETEVFPTDPSCYQYADGFITLIPQGGTPVYDIVWEGLDQTGQKADSLRAGRYEVSITDLNDCRLDTFAILEEPDSLYLLADITPPYCPDKYDGRIELDINGGTPPFQVNWVNYDNEGLYFEDLAQGTYQVEITDNQLCVFRDTFEL